MHGADMPAEALPIPVDLNRSGRSAEGTVYVFLTTRGARISLAKQGIELRDGMILNFYDEDVNSHGDRDDLVFQGEVHYSESQGWYACVQSEAIKNLSEVAGDPGHWANRVDWVAVHETERTWY